MIVQANPLTVFIWKLSMIGICLLGLFSAVFCISPLDAWCQREFEAHKSLPRAAVKHLGKIRRRTGTLREWLVDATCMLILAALVTIIYRAL